MSNTRGPLNVGKLCGPQCANLERLEREAEGQIAIKRYPKDSEKGDFVRLGGSRSAVAEWSVYLLKHYPKTKKTYASSSSSSWSQSWWTGYTGWTGQ